MLNHLVAYAREHLPDAEPGFKPKTARWAAVYSKGGRFLQIVELGDVGQKKNPGRTFARCPDLAQSELVGGSGSRCHFLVETAEVVALLYGKKAAEKVEEQEKIKAKHESFVARLRDASSTMPELGVIASSLEDVPELERLRSALEDHRAKSTEKITFQIEVGGEFPLDSTAWHEWWRAYRGGLSVSGEYSGPATAVCLVTGEAVQPVTVMPKIEGLTDVGGSPMGCVLVGFDKSAFTSYGLEQCANAPMSEATANAYRAALNDLVRNHAKSLGGAKVVYWFNERIVAEEDPYAWLTGTKEQAEHVANRRAAQLLDAVRAGKRTDLACNRYYSLTLSGSGGRVMVRDWMEGEFTELVTNVRRWFDDLSIVHREGGRLAPEPKFMAVLGVMVRELKDVPAPLVTTMWRVAAHGEPVPPVALAAALRRIAVSILKDEAANHAAMGLMKAYHVRTWRSGGEDMSDLKPMMNESHSAPSYHCGRLMAVFAALQRSALGDVGAGVVQRYYAAASVTPALVLGRLSRNAQFHLGKLDRPGLAHWYEDRLAAIWSRIGDAPPRTLTLEEQSLFALGYYQQLAHLRTKADTMADKVSIPDATKEESNV